MAGKPRILIPTSNLDKLYPFNVFSNLTKTLNILKYKEYLDENYFLRKNNVNKSFKYFILACFLSISMAQAEGDNQVGLDSNNQNTDELFACLMSDGKSWNECFSEGTLDSGVEPANPYSDIIESLSVPDVAGIISPGESIRNSLVSRQ